MNPYYYHIAQHKWDMFGTLTYAGDFFVPDENDARRGSGIRKSAAFKMLRRIASDRGIGFESAEWVMREETGEIGGRPHIHFLYRNLKQKQTTTDYCIKLHKFWKDKTESGSYMRPYNKWKDSASAYVVKDANQYELRKFNGVIEVTFSDAFRKRRKIAAMQKNTDDYEKVSLALS